LTLCGGKHAMMSIYLRISDEQLPRAGGRRGRKAP